CLDLDASLRLLGGRVHLGARRSPVHSPDAARALARVIADRPGFRLVGVMSYEAQTAGRGDNAPGLERHAVRLVQRMSRRELGRRRAAAVAAIGEVAPLEFVNGGGTGSLETTAAEDAVTELGAGSGLYGSTLFDTYRAFRPRPAAFFVLPVTRLPGPGVATVLGGGWIASGGAGRDRLPTPVWPEGLSLTGMEGAGEVQTPLTGRGTAGLRIGDRVWFRHTKAGELCEHVNELHLVEGGEIRESVPTYRGEGFAFL
ncbi:MAG TPA: amino acid deaminase/aldolase, partial [Phytomonospora sp.]